MFIYPPLAIFDGNRGNNFEKVVFFDGFSHRSFTFARKYILIHIFIRIYIEIRGCFFSNSEFSGQFGVGFSLAKNNEGIHCLSCLSNF